VTYNYAADGPIHTKFGTPMQNEMLVTTERLKSKPGIELQSINQSINQYF